MAVQILRKEKALLLEEVASLQKSYEEEEAARKALEGEIEDWEQLGQRMESYRMKLRFM